jgi:hypothetical protein
MPLLKEKTPRLNLFLGTIAFILCAGFLSFCAWIASSFPLGLHETSPFKDALIIYIKGCGAPLIIACLFGYLTFSFLNDL